MQQTIPRSSRTLYGLVAVGLLVFLGVPVLLIKTTQAAALTEVMVRFDRIKASTATSGTVCAKSGSTGQTSVSVHFPSAFTVSGTTTNWTTGTTTTGWPSGASAWPSIGANATSSSGNTVTWSSGSLSAGTLYCFNWTNNTTALTTSAAGTYTDGTVATNIDSATAYTTVIIADDVIQVQATVPQSITFSLSGSGTDNLGTLATGSVNTSPTPIVATLNSNAANGWAMWAKDSNTGLSSATASHLIPGTAAGNSSVLSAGTEGYNFGVDVTQTGGSASPSAGNYNHSATLGHGGGLDGTLRIVTSSTGTANNAQMTMYNNVAIAGTTPPAADYTDNVTVVAANMF